MPLSEDTPSRREFDSLSRTVERLDFEFNAFKDDFPNRIIGTRLYDANREADRLNNARQDRQIEKLEAIVSWVVRALISGAILAPLAGYLWQR